MNEVKGDLFTIVDDGIPAVAHCVSEDLAMGKGIAVEFKQRYGKVQELKAQQKRTGEVAYIQAESGLFVFYLITKKNYWQVPTYDDLYCSLLSLKELLVHHGITRIAMPRIGCGLDRLKWSNVADLILKALHGIDVTIAYL